MKLMVQSKKGNIAVEVQEENIHVVNGFLVFFHRFGNDNTTWTCTEFSTGFGISEGKPLESVRKEVVELLHSDSVKKLLMNVVKETYLKMESINDFSSINTGNAELIYDFV